MDFKKVYFADMEDAMKFADRYWQRVFNICFSDDFDGLWWIVHILKDGK